MMFLLSNSQLKLGTFFKSWHCDNQWQLANTCFDEEKSNGHMAIGSASEATTFGRTEIQQEGQHPLTGQRKPPISGGT